MECLPVRPDQISFVWPVIEPFVEGALPSFLGTYEAIDFRRACERGEMVLWIAIENKVTYAAIITKINEYPRYRTCNVMVVGGNGMALWLREAIEKIESYAKAIGCRRMEGGFRKGWARAAGYQEVGCVLTKEL